MPDSWISTFPGLQYALSYGKSIVENILKTGPVPRHVAFIMDGNRRFAKKHNQEAQEGHNAGFDSLSKVLEVCYNVGIEAVTVFAFSIENFNRSRYEVDNIMEIAKSRLNQLIQRGDLVEQYGIQIRIIGDLSLLPEDVLQVVEKVTKMSKNNHKAVLNICFPYTSRDDITNSIRKVVHLAETGQLDPSEINQACLEQNMYMGESPPLDILIRTSGVERLSDFMLWQAHHGTMIEFIPILWPQFSRRHMLNILFKWSLRKATQE